MIMPRHVQHAMNDETRELFPDADAEVTSIAAGDIRADVNVADQRIAERERDHIGHAPVAEVGLVQLRYRARSDKGDRHHGIAHALRA